MTIRKPARISGLDHPQMRQVEVVLSSAPAGHGIVFNDSLRADIDNARVSGHATCLGQGRRTIRMVEHLLAACSGLGVTDLAVDVSGSGMPVLDGSSRPYVQAFRRAGLVRRGEMSSWRPAGPVLVEKDDGFIAAVPSDKLRINCLVRFPEFGAQFVAVKVSPTVFERQIAPARTFVRTRQSPEFLQKTWGLRFRLKRQGRFVVPQWPRLPAEVCRHKLLDLLGDLALLGRRLQAELFAFRPGHRLNHVLVEALKRQSEAS